MTIRLEIPSKNCLKEKHLDLHSFVETLLQKKLGFLVTIPVYRFWPPLQTQAQEMCYWAKGQKGGLN